MKVLWLSSQPGLLDIPERRNSYNGGGWIGALQGLLKDVKECELAVAFPLSVKKEKIVQGGITYYPVYTPKETSLHKIKTYYGGYKKWAREEHVAGLQEAEIERKRQKERQSSMSSCLYVN